MTGRDHGRIMGAADAVPGQGGRRAESAAFAQGRRFAEDAPGTGAAGAAGQRGARGRAAPGVSGLACGPQAAGWPGAQGQQGKNEAAQGTSRAGWHGAQGPQMSALFARCRGIDPGQIARDEGMRLTGRGGRQYACCPFHGERHPSLLLDGRGGWHCFGCGRGGDAVALYAGLKRIGPGDAARQLAARYLHGEGGR